MSMIGLKNYSTRNHSISAYYTDIYICILNKCFSIIILIFKGLYSSALLTRYSCWIPSTNQSTGNQNLRQRVRDIIRTNRQKLF